MVAASPLHTDDVGGGGWRDSGQGESAGALITHLYQYITTSALFSNHSPDRVPYISINPHVVLSALLLHSHPHIIPALFLNNQFAPACGSAVLCIEFGDINQSAQSYHM
ncbi:hypothetical protein BaRGS_00002381 [Batillaria attramentaria]|uniref:Uncharacterized protein n=1 Tax=Batillaria attramentaria TaxID=370345 RepID=A0ABD0M2Y9_9CAEN